MGWLVDAFNRLNSDSVAPAGKGSASKEEQLPRDPSPDEARPARPFWAPALDSFTSAVGRRLRDGARVYGDRSWSREPAALIREVQEELEDVCGWSFVLWNRLEQVKRALEGVQLPARDEEIVL